jgi:uncharacterized membrane protein
MENQTPTPLNIPVNPPASSWKPSGGLTLAAFAGAVGQFAASLLRDFNVWNMTAETQGSLTVITMGLILYIHERKSK